MIDFPVIHTQVLHPFEQVSVEQFHEYGVGIYPATTTSSACFKKCRSKNIKRVNNDTVVVEHHQSIHDTLYISMPDQTDQVITT